MAASLKGLENSMQVDGDGKWNKKTENSVSNIPGAFRINVPTCYRETEYLSRAINVFITECLLFSVASFFKSLIQLFLIRLFQNNEFDQACKRLNQFLNYIISILRYLHIS